MNTCNVEINLSQGAVSKSILKAAGPFMQHECTKKRPPTFSHGDIISTIGFGLRVKFVYHAAPRPWDGGAGPCEQVSFILDKSSSIHVGDHKF